MSIGDDKPKVLCVDDEPQVLEGLVLHLRRRFSVTTCTSPQAALEQLPALDGLAAIVSDMRMPAMTGAEFLARARAVRPEAVRILLTGQTDLTSAIAAVNEGQIFRFLQKPTPPQVLLSVVDAACEQHRLLTAERVLLEQTLHGSIKALCDVLALTKPLLFGRATRLKQLAGAIAGRLALPNRWQVEVAAMLLHLGSVVLPDEVAEKVHFGRGLTAAEERMVKDAPQAAEQLIASIPRLEKVRAIMKLAAAAAVERTATPSDVGVAAVVLRAALDFERLTTTGTPPELACAELTRRADYDAPLLVALAEVVRAEAGTVADLKLDALRVGMVFAEDVRMTSGSVLVTRGYAVTPNFLERVRNFQQGVVREPVRVIVRGPSATLAA